MFLQTSDGKFVKGNGTAYYFEDFKKDGNGKLITKLDAKRYVSKYRTEIWEKLSGEEKKTRNVSVTFNRRILMFLLSQKDCEGIRFYYAMDDKNNVTLVLIGVNKFDYDLGANFSLENQVHQIDPLKKLHKSILDDKTPNEPDIEDTIIVEVGGGHTYYDFGKDLTP